MALMPHLVYHSRQGRITGLDQGATPGGPSNNWSSARVRKAGCWHYDYGGDGTIEAGITYSQIKDSRDAFNVWMGLTRSLCKGWNWVSDAGAVQDFPDEMGADIVANEIDEDIDGDSFNNTIDMMMMQTVFMIGLISMTTMTEYGIISIWIPMTTSMKMPR